MEISLIACNVALLLVACIVALIAKWIKQPYPTALVIVGLLVALTNLVPHFQISHDVTFTLILPPLLFYGAMHMDLERLKNNWRSITLLAVPGVICSTLLIGYGIHVIFNIEIMYALLLGALITPTDPVSVLSILKEVKAPKRLAAILEGESLFNDGTSVVIFSLILAVVSGGERFEFGASIVEFLKVTGGGTIIGIIFGTLIHQIFKRIKGKDLEIALTVVMVFGVPLIAEYFHLSGIIAIVVAGLVVGNWGRHCTMSPETIHDLDSFWEVISFMINSLLFLAIGIELQVINKSVLMELAVPIVLTIILVLVVRALVVYPIVWLTGKSGNAIPPHWAHVLFWSGLKGSISIALVVGLPENFIYREMFLIVAFTIVLFTLIVQALTMKPLLTKLGLANPEGHA